MSNNNIRVVPPQIQNLQNDNNYRVKTDKVSSFESQLTETKQAVQSPYKKFEQNQDSSSNLSKESWLRQRTIEELKTLVKAVSAGIKDPWALTDLIFYSRHPEMKGVAMTSEHADLLDEWNTISALLVHPTLNEIGNYIGTDFQKNSNLSDTEKLNNAFTKASKFHINAGDLSKATTRYDDIIANAVSGCPGLEPAILKSLLQQESAFNPSVINKYGYAGIAQFGKPAAREVGLSLAGINGDERLDPSKAIPGAARLLKIKAQRLGEMAFSRYGQPNGIDFWKFVLAAYNGGEGTVAVAMGHGYRVGMDKARQNGLVGMEAVSYARRYASNWENLKVGGTGSPLGLAAARYFPKIATSKYHEIGNYPTQIVARVSKG
jgi:soluble lytic murein transglycosylase-like protein